MHRKSAGSAATYHVLFGKPSMTVLVDIRGLLMMENGDIYDLLYRLGITAKYVGFLHVSYAVRLILIQPERIQLVTKWLYPDVANHYGTNWKAVERNIRTVISIAWDLRPEVLDQIAGRHLEHKPRASQFLAILAAYFRLGKAA